MLNATLTAIFAGSVTASAGANPQGLVVASSPSFLVGDGVIGDATMISEGAQFTISGASGTVTYTYTYLPASGYANPILLTTGGTAANVLAVTLAAINGGTIGVTASGVVLSGESQINLANSTGLGVSAGMNPLGLSLLNAGGSPSLLVGDGVAADPTVISEGASSRSSGPAAP